MTLSMEDEGLLEELGIYGSEIADETKLRDVYRATRSVDNPTFVASVAWRTEGITDPPLRAIASTLAEIRGNYSQAKRILTRALGKEIRRLRATNSTPTMGDLRRRLSSPPSGNDHKERDCLQKVFSRRTS